MYMYTLVCMYTYIYIYIYISPSLCIYVDYMCIYIYDIMRLYAPRIGPEAAEPVPFARGDAVGSPAEMLFLGLAPKLIYIDNHRCVYAYIYIYSYRLIDRFTYIYIYIYIYMDI